MVSASIKYADSADRAFGLCGMALALFIFDSEQYLDSLSLDAPADMGLGLSPDFFVAANQNLSAKDVWKFEFRNFQLVSAMVIGNLLSRSLTRRDSDVSSQVKNLLYSFLEKEGEDACGLDDSEVARLCDQTYSYLHRLFRHPSVNSTVKAMAQELETARTLTRDNVMHYLAPLNRL